MYVSFIDYSAAFDSVSHKFIDKTLKETVRFNNQNKIDVIYRVAITRTEV